MVCSVVYRMVLCGVIYFFGNFECGVKCVEMEFVMMFGVWWDWFMVICCFEIIWIFLDLVGIVVFVVYIFGCEIFW